MKIYCIYCDHCHKTSSDRARCDIHQREISSETAWNLRECPNWQYNSVDTFKRGGGKNGGRIFACDENSRELCSM